MRAVAIPMILLMLSASLAGCTSGDPDGDDNSGIDMEILNQMIDDNLQDFINNTSVTVNQEIHYHNNTTVVNNYDETNNEFSNTTNVEGQDVTNYNSNNYTIGGGVGGNGSGVSSVIQVIRVDLGFNTELENYGERDFIIDGLLQYPAIDYVPTMSYNIGGVIYSLDFTCEEYYNAKNVHYSYWEEWARYELGLSYSDADVLGRDIAMDLYELAAEGAEYCFADIWNIRDVERIESELFSINITTGEAISFIQTSTYFSWNLTCIDGYSGQPASLNDGELIGGWSDCTFIAYDVWWAAAGWNDIPVDSDSSNNNNNSNTSSTDSEMPSWFDYADRNYWYTWEINEASLSSSFNGTFYYNKYFVVPVE